MQNNSDITRSPNFMKERIMMRMSESKLTPEDWQALRKARNQVYNHAGIGGIVGGTGVYYLLRKRRISPFLMVPMVCGGLLFGSQIGMGSGLRAGMKTIDKLPEGDNVKKLADNIRNDVLAFGGKIYDSNTNQVRPMTQNEREDYEKALKDTHNKFINKRNSIWGDDASQQQQQEQQQESYELQELQKEQPQEQDGLLDLKEQSAWDKVRQSSDNSNNKKTNKYGDPVE